MASPIKYGRKIFQKTDTPYPQIQTLTCAYEEIRNVSFSGKFAYILNGCSGTKVF